MTYFDHLVITARDQLEPMAMQAEKLGFHLTPTAHHNIGSANRLIMLNSSYIELLGWPKGTTPQRPEISDLPIGLDALVFRISDAQQCHDDLLQAGFEPNPPSLLSRPLEVDGQAVIAQFDTVRFKVQPIPGIRIYFCHHITPQYVWLDEYLKHPNAKTKLEKIVLESSDPKKTAVLLCQILGLSPGMVQELPHNGALKFLVRLENCVIELEQNLHGNLSKISSCVLADQQSSKKLFISIKELTSC